MVHIKRRLIFTIFVPYSMACLEWKVPCFPVNPWQTLIRSLQHIVISFRNKDEQRLSSLLTFARHILWQTFTKCFDWMSDEDAERFVSIIFTWQMTLLSLVSNMFGRVCRRNGITRISRQWYQLRHPQNWATHKSAYWEILQTLPSEIYLGITAPDSIFAASG